MFNSIINKVEYLFMNKYKKIILIPIAILILSLVILGVSYIRTGQFVDKDISLKGGISATINTDKQIAINEIEQKLTQKFPGAEINVRRISDYTTNSNTGFIVEVTTISQDDLKNELEKIFDTKLTQDNYSVNVLGALLGASFYRGMIIAIIFAFLFMSIVVFIAFRKLVPSIAVILTALIDILATLAVVNLLGIKISTGAIAAFLLLIGYSIDSDILLTTKVTKRLSERLWDRVLSAMKTGLTMTITTLVAVTVAYIFTNSTILKQIFLIIIIGLLFDIISTYLGNAPALIWYTKKHEN